MLSIREHFLCENVAVSSADELVSGQCSSTVTPMRRKRLHLIMDLLGAANHHLSGSLRHTEFTPRWCAVVKKKKKNDGGFIFIITVIITSVPIIGICLPSEHKIYNIV